MHLGLLHFLYSTDQWQARLWLSTIHGTVDHVTSGDHTSEPGQSRPPPENRSDTNLPPILHRFRDIAVDRSEIAILGYPSCVYKSPGGGVPLGRSP